MPTCHNCKAEVPKCGTDPKGRPICCAACLFNPLGCRCQFGELGVLETQQPFFDEDDDPDYDDDIRRCPDCESPNQFGELCPACMRERAERY